MSDRDNNDKDNKNKYDFEEESLKTVFDNNDNEIKEEEENEPQKKEGYVVKSQIIEGETDSLAPINISSEMRDSFLEYAMSVIVSRALPDARDGLKPVHRRILYAMSELGMYFNVPHKKSARIVGEVIGKYHPHGDSSVYEAMVRMAQDFSMRYKLIDGHGNFGSIDGDGAAAMRYTEARMTKIAMKMIDGIKKDTVDFVPNYDAAEIEPVVLPSKIPNLLMTGATGIAVGMATSIPPHNLTNVIDGIIAYARNQNIEIDELIDIVQGPDFPTSGIIMGTNGIKQAYTTGNGSIVVRSRTRIEELKNGKKRIVVTEIPYMINKAKMIEKIALLSNAKIITGISEIRDETSREGIRVVIIVKRDAIAEVVLNKLFKLTPLQSNFSVNMIALVDGAPKLMNLKLAISVYFKYQLEVLTRQTQFNLNKAKERSHILEGLKIAIQNIDDVIRIIRSSNNDAIAQETLSKKFKLSDKQTKAIIDMRLGRLTGLAISKMEEELKELIIEIKQLENILNNHDFKVETLISQLEETKEKFGDERKTEIIHGSYGDILDEDLIPKEEVVLTLSKKGYVKRISLNDYRLQKRGGRGARTMSTYDDDDVNEVIVANTHTDLLIFTSFGKVYKIRVHNVPIASKQSKGTPLINIIGITKGEYPISILPIKEYSENMSLLTVTTKGIVKKTTLLNYERINKNGKIALGLKDGDSLLKAMLVSEDDEIFIGASNGKVVRFPSSQLRNISRASMGVKGISLSNKSDKVISASTTKNGNLVLSIGSLGFGKMTTIHDYRITKRGAKGVNSLNVNKAGNLVTIEIVKGNEELIILTTEGILVRTSLDEISRSSRTTKGVKVIDLKDNNKIATIAVVRNSEEIDKEIEEVYQKTQEIKIG